MQSRRVLRGLPGRRGHRRGLAHGVRLELLRLLMRGGGTSLSELRGRWQGSVGGARAFSSFVSFFFSPSSVFPILIVVASPWVARGQSLGQQRLAAVEAHEVELGRWPAPIFFCATARPREFAKYCARRSRLRRRHTLDTSLSARGAGRACREKRSTLAHCSRIAEKE